MPGKEHENSKTILAIFRAIEERNDAQFRILLHSDFEIHWPRSLPYGGTFRGLEPQPHGWGATWAALQPTEAERKMDARVVAATTMMLWSCGVSEGAPSKVIFWTKKYSDCTASSKAN